MTFRAQRQIWSDTVALLIGKRDRSGDLTHYVADLTLSPYTKGDAIMTPPLQLKADEARELMDELWHAGVRPSNGEGNTGQLGATQKHLEDMRTLVFNARNVAG